MSTEIEDLLREGMRRRAAEGLVPPGRAGRMWRRTRHRRLAARGVAAVGTAAAAAAALALTTSSAGGGVTAAQSTAYIVRHVANAITAAADNGLIMYTRGSSSPAVPGIGPAYNWAYGNTTRTKLTTADGRAQEDVQVTTTTPGTARYTFADYQRKVWLAGTGHTTPVPAQTSCPTDLFAIRPAKIPSAIQQMLTCGDLAYAGKQRVDRVLSIKIVGRGVLTGITIWVNPATYLPVRMGLWFTNLGSASYSVTDYQWLPPTKANLGQLDVAIPPGFTKLTPIPCTRLGEHTMGWYNGTTTICAKLPAHAASSGGRAHS
jgi:hypothetical protein